jgi:hypothetical protein
LILLLVCLGAGTMCASAQGSSILFLRDSNIWIANPDGSGPRQVTSDGTSGSPYLYVSTAKQGSPAVVGFLRYDASGSPSFVYGTVNPDGSGYATDPASGMAGFTQGDDHQMALDAVGDRIAWSRATNIGHGETFSPYSVGIDGSNEESVSRAGSAVDTIFGDPTGQSLLFDDNVASDYRDANNSAEGWPLAPAVCTHGTSASGFVRQLPVGDGGTLAAPAAYYCPAGNTDLFQPALSPDGQTIAAAANTTPNSGSNPSFTSGQPRLVVFPTSAVASGSTPTSLTFLTPDGPSAGRPDFSPDGTQIVFSGPDGIYVVPTAGGSATKVLDNASIPAWSPYTLPAGGTGGIGGTGGTGGTGGSGGTTGGTASRPDTRISGRAISKRRHSAAFKFKAIGHAAGFQCALVKHRKLRRGHRQPKPTFSRCSSPKAYEHLAHATYTFYVRAGNAAGYDLTPAGTSFRI